MKGPARNERFVSELRLLRYIFYRVYVIEGNRGNDSSSSLWRFFCFFVLAYIFFSEVNSLPTTDSDFTTPQTANVRTGTYATPCHTCNGVPAPIKADVFYRPFVLGEHVPYHRYRTGTAGDDQFTNGAQPIETKTKFYAFSSGTAHPGILRTPLDPPARGAPTSTCITFYVCQRPSKLCTSRLYVYVAETSFTDVGDLQFFGDQRPTQRFLLYRYCISLLWAFINNCLHCVKKHYTLPQSTMIQMLARLD